MNLKDIRELIEILKDSDVSEFELERSGTRISIRKGGASPAKSAGGQVAYPVQVSPPPSEAAPQPVAQSAVQAEEPVDSKVVVMNSPIVGTFYRSPSPEASSYVEVGDTVKKGQVLCIIEAMKLMNEIEAEVGGKIVKILPENAQPVEYGEALFHIEPM